jgi:hypothetical protein
MNTSKATAFRKRKQIYKQRGRRGVEWFEKNVGIDARNGIAVVRMFIRRWR